MHEQIVELLCMGDVCEACYGLQSIFNIGFICEVDIIPIFTHMGKPTLKSGMSDLLHLQWSKQ